MVCCEKAVYFLASKKKIQILEGLDKNKEEKSNVPAVKLLIRDKNDKDKANISKLIDAIKTSKGGSKIGVYVKDKFSSDLIDAWRKAVKDANFEQALFLFSGIVSPQLAKHIGDLLYPASVGYGHIVERRMI
ncbi:FACT complex subunit SPT16-like [Cherax quadricarinatus]|uniref:FACT complex subunit SPT16-like n=1 Tax=Cherax quadricarinatus TaxID=27406 RepID=UPI00387E622A